MKVFFAREYRTLGEVPRWSIVRLNKEQSVLEHTGLVAMYALDICEILKYEWKGDGIDVRAVLKWALQHDFPEVVSGDIPSPVKKMIGTGESNEEFENRVFKNRYGIVHEDYPEYVETIVKTADLLEAVLKLTSELARGNGTVMGVLPQLSQYLFDQMDSAYTDSAECEALRQSVVHAISMEYSGTDGVGGRTKPTVSEFWQELQSYDEKFAPNTV